MEWERLETEMLEKTFCVKKGKVLFMNDADANKELNRVKRARKRLERFIGSHTKSCFASEFVFSRVHAEKYLTFLAKYERVLQVHRQTD